MLPVSTRLLPALDRSSVVASLCRSTRWPLAALLFAITIVIGSAAPSSGYADLAPPRLNSPRPQKPVKQPKAAKAAVAKTEVLKGEIKRHPYAGTKREMVDGRYHLYSGKLVYELVSSKEVTEARMDQVAGKRVAVTVRRREIAEDRNIDVREQRPIGGLPAKTVYDLISLKIL